MSQLNSLLESANPYKSLQSDAARLASKWAKTGLLEGLSDQDSNNMSMLLENQAKQLVTETSNTGGGAKVQVLLLQVEVHNGQELLYH